VSKHCRDTVVATVYKWMVEQNTGNLKSLCPGYSGRGELTPSSAIWKNAGIFYFLLMIKFSDSEFIFAIKDPIQGRGGV